MITCVAVLGKDNEPLYIESFGTTSPAVQLHHHYQIHLSLDALEERYLPNVRYEKPEMFFGLLLAIEDERIYGYCTNTKIKFIAIAKDVVPETNIRTFLRATHSLYVSAVCNPFSQIGGMLDAASFTRELVGLFKSLNIIRYPTVGLETILAPLANVDVLTQTYNLDKASLVFQGSPVNTEASMASTSSSPSPTSSSATTGDTTSSPPSSGTSSRGR